MSFMEYPQPDACRALMPAPEPSPPGPPSRPMVCHMPKGHEGPHALTRHPRGMDRRWEGDARPTPPEVVPAGERVETMARAMWDITLQPIPWGDVNGPTQALYRRLAAAAIAALPPSPAEEAVKRVEALADELLSDAESAITPGYYRDAADRLRAALASPAPAPQGDRVVARPVDSAFRCEVCGERCTSKRVLGEHMAGHR